MSSENLSYLKFLELKYSELCELLKGRTEDAESRFNFAKKLCGGEQLSFCVDSEWQKRNQKLKIAVKLEVCCQGLKLAKSVKLHYCPYLGCRYSSRIPQSVRNHKRVHDTAKPFKCRKCEYATKWKTGLREHMAYKHNSLKGGFKCQFANCSFQTTNNAYLSEHHNRVHLKLKPFKCDFSNCDYASVSKRELIIHKLVHSESKPFKCDFKNCSFATKWKHSLSEHSATHSGNSVKIKCQQCNYVTHSKKYLSSHRKIHSNSKPFKCTFQGCNYACRRRYSLKEHQAVHTKVKQFKCD